MAPLPQQSDPPQRIAKYNRRDAPMHIRRAPIHMKLNVRRRNNLRRNNFGIVNSSGSFHSFAVS
jgi:hypothetical protein